MRRFLPILLLLLAAAAVWVLSQLPESAPGPNASIAPPAAPGHDAAAATTARREEATAPQRGSTLPLAQVPNGAADDPSLVHLRGRCIAAEDGHPLAGCTVTFENSHRVVVVTGSDGVFAMHAELDARSARLMIAAADRVLREGEVGRLEAGQRDDLGDIALPRGWQVTGVVVDGEGAGVGDVLLTVDGVDLRWSHGGDLRHYLTAVSDARGRFTFESPLPPGEYAILAGHLPEPRLGVTDVRALLPANQLELAPACFAVDGTRGSPALHLVVQPTREIAGWVVDDAGEPVDGVQLRTAAGDWAVSTADGRFRLRALHGDGTTAQLRVTDPGRCDADDTVRELAWGSRNVEVVLRRGVDLGIEVVDDSGAPVDAADIYCAPVGAVGMQLPRTAERQGPGLFVVSGVRRGANVVQVSSEREDLLPGVRSTIEVADGMPTLRLQLLRMQPVQVQVVDRFGAALAGARVQLVHASEPPAAGRFGHLSRTAMDFWGADGTWLVSEADTDATGCARIAAPATTRELMLGVDRDGCVPAIVPAPQFAAAPLRVMLDAVCTLSGVVELNGQPWRLHELVLRDAQGSVPPHLELERVRPAPDGTFRIEHLAPGNYTLQLCRQLECDDNAFEPGGVPVQDAEVAVHLDAGASRTVHLRALPPHYGSVRGRLSVDGRLAAGWSVDLVRSDTFTRRGSFVTDAGGGFVAGQLLPGRYHMAVRAPGVTPLEGIAILKQDFEVGPAADVARDFDFTRRRLVLHVRSDSPLPLAIGLRIGGWTSFWVSGRDVVLDPAPELPVQLGGHAGAKHWSAPVTMPQDRLEYEVEVVVPVR